MKRKEKRREKSGGREEREKPERIFGGARRNRTADKGFADLVNNL
jgi:hypothetical protein